MSKRRGYSPTDTINAMQKMLQAAQRYAEALNHGDLPDEPLTFVVEISKRRAECRLEIRPVDRDARNPHRD